MQSSRVMGAFLREEMEGKEEVELPRPTPLALVGLEMPLALMPLVGERETPSSAESESESSF